MPSALQALRKRFPNVEFVSREDFTFLKSCRLDPATDDLACAGSGEIVLAKALCLAFKAIREAAKKPIRVTSGFRSEAYQLELIRRGYKAAKVSPHTFGMALDLEVPEGFTQESFAKLIRKVLKNQVRVGFKAYAGQGFVHIDLAFLLNPNPAPQDYKPGVTW